MKLAWLTDIHLNFISPEERIDFYQKIVGSAFDKILITGDIAEATLLVDVLKEMVRYIKKPIYFVLGNHDYYHSSVSFVERAMMHLTKQEKLLYCMPYAGIQQLKPNILLAGVNNWADGRYGDYVNTNVIVSDSFRISELSQSYSLGKYFLVKKMQQLADDAVDKLQHDLVDAIKVYRPEKIIIMAHIPPFPEFITMDTKPPNKETINVKECKRDDFLPFFSSKATGDFLSDLAQKYPNIQYMVLSGHTHNEFTYSPYKNLTVKTGGAQYGEPRISEILTI